MKVTLKPSGNFAGLSEKRRIANSEGKKCLSSFVSNLLEGSAEYYNFARGFIYDLRTYPQEGATYSFSDDNGVKSLPDVVIKWMNRCGEYIKPEDRGLSSNRSRNGLISIVVLNPAKAERFMFAIGLRNCPVAGLDALYDNNFLPKSDRQPVGCENGEFFTYAAVGSDKGSSALFVAALLDPDIYLPPLDLSANGTFGRNSQSSAYQKITSQKEGAIESFIENLEAVIPVVQAIKRKHEPVSKEQLVWVREVEKGGKLDPSGEKTR